MTTICPGSHLVMPATQQNSRRTSRYRQREEGHRDLATPPRAAPHRHSSANANDCRWVHRCSRAGTREARPDGRTSSFHYYYTNPMAECEEQPMIPTWVFGWPSGKEKGSYLAVDLGGTNLRVCEVELEGEGKFAITQSKYRLTDEQKLGDGQALCRSLSPVQDSRMA